MIGVFISSGIQLDIIKWVVFVIIPSSLWTLCTAAKVRKQTSTTCFFNYAANVEFMIWILMPSMGRERCLAISYGLITRSIATRNWGTCHHKLNLKCCAETGRRCAAWKCRKWRELMDLNWLTMQIPAWWCQQTLLGRRFQNGHVTPCSIRITYPEQHLSLFVIKTTPAFHLLCFITKPFNNSQASPRGLFAVSLDFVSSTAATRNDHSGNYSNYVIKWKETFTRRRLLFGINFNNLAGNWLK